MPSYPTGLLRSHSPGVGWATKRKTYIGVGPEGALEQIGKPMQNGTNNRSVTNWWSQVPAEISSGLTQTYHEQKI
jgi:hypothetical protein